MSTDNGNFAFTKEPKVPIHDAAHIRNAIARFKQVKDVTDLERDEAWQRIKAAAQKHQVDLQANDWRELA
jgi:cell division protein FtsX